ncbi:MAG TPA: hypothetical protein VGA67_04825, partial [Candidatus Dojkabacteria bacterium]
MNETPVPSITKAESFEKEQMHFEECAANDYSVKETIATISEGDNVIGNRITRERIGVSKEDTETFKISYTFYNPNDKRSDISVTTERINNSRFTTFVRTLGIFKTELKCYYVNSLLVAVRTSSSLFEFDKKGNLITSSLPNAIDEVHIGTRIISSDETHVYVKNKNGETFQFSRTLPDWTEQLIAEEP